MFKTGAAEADLRGDERDRQMLGAVACMNSRASRILPSMTSPSTLLSLVCSPRATHRHPLRPVPDGAGFRPPLGIREHRAAFLNVTGDQVAVGVGLAPGDLSFTISSARFECWQCLYMYPSFTFLSSADFVRFLQVTKCPNRILAPSRHCGSQVLVLLGEWRMRSSPLRQGR